MNEDAPVTRRELREAMATVEAIVKAQAAAYIALIDQLSEEGSVDIRSLMRDLRTYEEDARKRNERESAIKTLRSYRLALADSFGLPDDPVER